MAAHMILIVEDNASIARSLTAQILREIPQVAISVVSDGENAIRALSGERYREFDPRSQAFEERAPASFVAAIWDNNFPESEDNPGCCVNVGLKTIEALKSSQKVNESVLSHFFSHSSDEQLPLSKSEHFFKIYHKPIKNEQVKELCSWVTSWMKNEVNMTFESFADGMRHLKV